MACVCDLNQQIGLAKGRHCRDVILEKRLKKITAKVVPDAELKVLFDECDADGGATICLAEFTALLGGDPVRRTAPRICQP